MVTQKIMLEVINIDVILCAESSQTQVLLLLFSVLWPYFIVCRIWISIIQLILQAKGEERGGPSGPRNNLRLHPLRIIEQISNEQLLPVKMTRFHFIAMDKRSDSICMLHLSAIVISLPIPAFNISWQT